MNHTDVCETSLTASVTEACVSALSQRFASRGLTKSVLKEASERMEAEEKTRSLDPCAYRLSLLSEAAVDGIYKRGKSEMETADLIRYADESLRIRRGECEVEECVSIYEQASVKLEALPAEVSKTETKHKLIPVEWKRIPAKAVTCFKERVPLWFSNQMADSSKGKKKLPISVFAAVLAVTVSLVMIVASTLMITHTKTKISKLNSEISTLHSEIGDLEAKLESGNDMMEIRRIAVEEYGMVGEEHLRTEYLAKESKEDIEVYEQKRDKSLGLSAILSAIGWKK